MCVHNAQEAKEANEAPNNNNNYNRAIGTRTEQDGKHAEHERSTRKNFVLRTCVWYERWRRRRRPRKRTTEEENGKEEKKKWEKVENDRTCSTAALYSKCFTSEPCNKISLYPTTGYTPLSIRNELNKERAMRITEHRRRSRNEKRTRDSMFSLSLLQYCISIPTIQPAATDDPFWAVCSIPWETKMIKINE